MKLTVAKKMALVGGSALLGIIMLAGLGQYQMNKVYEAANFANINTVPALVALDQMRENFMHIRIRALQHAMNPDAARMAELDVGIKSNRAGVDKALKDYEPTLADDKDKEFFNQEKNVWGEYQAQLEPLLAESRAHHDDKVRDALDKLRPVGNKLADAIGGHIEYNVTLGKKGSDDAIATKSSAMMLSLIISALTIVAVGGISYTVARAFLRQLGGEPDHAADIANKIAAGNLSSKIDIKAGDTTSLMVAMKGMTTSIQALVADAEVLSQAAVDGKLSTRADASKHKGDFQKIVSGVNQTLDAVIGPLNVAANYVDRISKGDMPPKITDSYNGDFNTIKNNLNTCIDAVNALIADANMLSRAAVEGKLETRADASRHQGDFSKIVKGINDTLDNVIGPINEIRRLMDAMEKGDMTQTISKSYQGDFDLLKQAINNTVEKLAQIIGEVNVTTETIVSATTQISSTAQSLSQAASEQAASVEETSASVEQM
jgi:methyl-accepting chemotaxis protein